MKGDAPRERFGGLAQEFRRGTAEHEKATCRIAIDERSEDRKQFGSALDFVEHDKSAERAKGEFGLAEPSQIAGQFEIKVVGWAAPRCLDLVRQRGLADLSCAEEGHARYGSE